MGSNGTETTAKTDSGDIVIPKHRQNENSSGMTATMTTKLSLDNEKDENQLQHQRLPSTPCTHQVTPSGPDAIQILTSLASDDDAIPTAFGDTSMDTSGEDGEGRAPCSPRRQEAAAPSAQGKQELSIHMTQSQRLSPPSSSASGQYAGLRPSPPHSSMDHLPIQLNNTTQGIANNRAITMTGAILVDGIDYSYTHQPSDNTDRYDDSYDDSSSKDDVEASNNGGDHHDNDDAYRSEPFFPDSDDGMDQIPVLRRRCPMHEHDKSSPDDNPDDEETRRRRFHERLKTLENEMQAGISTYHPRGLPTILSEVFSNASVQSLNLNDHHDGDNDNINGNLEASDDGKRVANGASGNLRGPSSPHRNNGFDVDAEMAEGQLPSCPFWYAPLILFVFVIVIGSIVWSMVSKNG